MLDIRKFHCFDVNQKILKSLFLPIFEQRKKELDEFKALFKHIMKIIGFIIEHYPSMQQIELYKFNNCVTSNTLSQTFHSHPKEGGSTQFGPPIFLRFILYSKWSKANQQNTFYENCPICFNVSVICYNPKSNSEELI